MVHDASRMIEKAAKCVIVLVLLLLTRKVAAEVFEAEGLNQ